MLLAFGLFFTFGRIITMAEASFLAAREARSLHRAPAARREEKDRLNEFWASLKEYTKDWNDRLATLAASDPPTTESEKRRLQEQFTELAQQLHSVRKLCLSVSSGAGSSAAEEESQHHHHVAADAVNSFVPPRPPEEGLSVADVRLLHRELTQCQEVWDKTKSMLLPKGKFVFRRYREAVRQREETKKNATDNSGESDHCRNPDTSTSVDDAASAQAKTSPTTFQQKSEPSTSEERDTERGTLKDLDHAEILVDVNGRVELLLQNKEDGTTVAAEAPTLVSMGHHASSSSTLILRNLQSCTVRLQGAYTSLHMVNVQDSVVRVTPHAIQGAAHVTNCHRSTIVLQSQQLRLHESTDLTCRVQVSAGAILEDCSRVVFQCQAQATGAPPLDVKDFDWLRNGIPSPNFRVEAIEEDELDKTVDKKSAPERGDSQASHQQLPDSSNERGLASEGHSAPKQNQSPAAAMMALPTAESPPPQTDDDDDEL